MRHFKTHDDNEHLSFSFSFSFKMDLMEMKNERKITNNAMKKRREERKERGHERDIRGQEVMKKNNYFDPSLPLS